MSEINELFEKWYAEQNDVPIENVKSCRLANGSYNCLAISRVFRAFQAGFVQGVRYERDKLP